MNLRLDYTEDELLGRFAGYPLLFAPGEEWSYSNSGYVLLGMIIRVVTGEPGGEFLRRRVFEPLGMKTARVINCDDIIPNRAAGNRLRDGSLKNREPVGPAWNTTADGSLHLTLLDLAAWDAALYGHALLSNSTKALMWAPGRLNDGTLASYGFGWQLMDAPGRRTVEHDGGGWGFRTHIGRFPDDSLTVIALVNSTTVDPTEIGHRVAALYRPALAPPPRTAIRLARAVLDEYVGAYRLPSGEVLRVSRTGLPTNSGRRTRPTPPGTMGSRGMSPSTRRPSSRVVFVRDQRGDVSWLRLRRHPSSPVRARRLP